MSHHLLRVEGEVELIKEVFTVLFLLALESVYKLCLAVLSDCGGCGLKVFVQLKVCNYLWLHIKNDHQML